MSTCSYVASRIYLHNPPGENNALTVPHDAPEELKHAEQHLREEEPLTNSWACMILLLVAVAILSVTAEMVRLSTLVFPPAWLTPRCFRAAAGREH